MGNHDIKVCDCWGKCPGQTYKHTNTQTATLLIKILYIMYRTYLLNINLVLTQMVFLR